MAARLGAPVFMVGRVGNDVFGQGVLNNLRAEGIEVSHVWTTPNVATGSAAILVDDAGRNSIVVVPGANALLTPQDLTATGDTFNSASVLLCQIEVPLETALAAIRLARAAGARTILNPAPAFPLPDELLLTADF